MHHASAYGVFEHRIIAMTLTLAIAIAWTAFLL